MRTQSLATNKIKPNPRNTRKHSARQIRQIAGSIVALGFRFPLLVSEDNELISGHGRLQAAQLLGLEQVPVIVAAGLSPTKRRALAIADNKVAANAKWDRERLAIEIPELTDMLTAEGLDISILGFEAIELKHIRAESGEDDTADPRDRMDPNWFASAVSEPGDLWLLGDHKLLCGNALCSKDTAHLMADCRADAAFFDTPASREVFASDFNRLLRMALKAAESVSREGAIHFVCLHWRHMADVMEAARPVYGDAINVAVWVKSEAAGDGCIYREQHEFVGVFRVGKAPRGNIEAGRRKRSRANVWHYRAVHPCCGIDDLGARLNTKPVALIADAIKDCTKNGDTVLDLCSGSGTTIIAAESVGRRARALEAEPRLVDAAVRRWQAFTRRDALHAESGESFDQIAAKARFPHPVR